LGDERAERGFTRESYLGGVVENHRRNQVNTINGSRGQKEGPEKKGGGFCGVKQTLSCHREISQGGAVMGWLRGGVKRKTKRFKCQEIYKGRKFTRN